ncbi:hypothetical protein F3J44_17430 [Pantoea sp. Tr-811]|uniref:hypothetical protein n=1 Tax=Pantoea sp. Tr-811 TaxID=2608361 RepID=UPI00141FD856|nr:hypothetical protein [Pantoea sp. Tr-811]NIF28153.1 hypothetical protein [Pantoea sp. Tr-811]
MRTKRAGDLDLSYGDKGDGIARIPPMGGLDPDTHSLQIYPVGWANDGSAAMYGFNPDDPLHANKVFTRMNADGHWDRETGHVPISKNQNGPMPLQFDDFTALTYTTGNAQDGVLTAGKAYYFEGDDVYQEIVVGRYTEHFAPWPGFADDGIATTRPVLAPGSQLRDEHISPQVATYISAPKLALAAGLIRVVFKSMLAAADGSITEKPFA